MRRDQVRPRSNYALLDETKDSITLMDCGPWDQHPTITNDAEFVVTDLINRLNGRRLLYIDSLGDRTELLIKDNKFAGFGPG